MEEAQGLRAATLCGGAGRLMLALHAGLCVFLARGATDMRKGFDGLAAQVQTALKAEPFSGHLFLFRGRRGELLKALWRDGQGLVLLAQRLEKGRLIWPPIAREGVVRLTTAHCLRIPPRWRR